MTGAGFCSDVGMIAAAMPPIVVSAQPAKEEATSPNFGAGRPLEAPPAALAALPAPPIAAV